MKIRVRLSTRKKEIGMNNKERTDMKKIIYLIPLLALVASCTQKESVSIDVNSFDFYGSNVTTKVSWALSDTISVNWESEDRVAIFGHSGAEVLGNNCKYSVKELDADGKNCKFYPENPSQMVKFKQNAQISFYSYYPFKEGEDDAHSINCAIPEEQVQSGVNSTSHLSSLCMFYAEPITVFTGDDGGDIILTYKNITPVLELDIKLDNSSSIDVPIKAINLSSSSNVAIACNKATIDITSPESKVNCATGNSDAIRLSFSSETVLHKGKSNKFYFTIAPGNHVSEDLNIEIVAIDESKASTRLKGAVAIEQGKVYRKAINLSAEDFKPASQFEVVQESVSGKVGQPVRFDFTGSATEITLFSGEKGHDYIYSKEGRTERAERQNMSFIMRGDPSGSKNAFNPGYAALSYSSDFDGIMQEDDILSATWSDISSNFTLPSAIKTDTPSGVYDILPLYPADKDTLYFRFDYQFNAGTSEIGRTIIYVKAFDVVGSYSGYSDVTICSLATAEWNVVLPSSNMGGAKVNLPGSSLQFTAGSWKPSAPGQAWAITKVAVAKFDIGTDEGVVVKASLDEMPSSYEHIYSEEGDYLAVFAVTTQTLFGYHETIIQVPVTITR